MAVFSALQEFESSLGLAEQLLDLEQQYGDPPSIFDETVVRGLRGGAAVLMVAAFEEFLRAVMAEHLAKLAGNAPPVPFDDLPKAIRLHSVYGALDRAMKGARYEEPTDRIDRLSDIVRVCRQVGNVIDPSVFAETGGNPSSRNLRELFKRVEISDIFRSIRGEFEVGWGGPQAETFIADKLDEIVNRRHVVAHRASVLNVARRDLRQGFRFLQLLARVLDLHLKDHIDTIITQKGGV